MMYFEDVRSEVVDTENSEFVVYEGVDFTR